MDQLTRQKHSRYVPGQVPAFRFKDTDREILLLVYRHRFLSTPLLSALLCKEQTAEGSAIGRDGKKRPAKYGFSEKALYRRLQLLFHARYLERHHFTDRPIGRGMGSSPAIYGLGTKGADIVAEAIGEPVMVLKKIVDQNKVRTPFLRHALQIANFRVILQLACLATKGRVRLLYWEQGQHLRDSVQGQNEDGIEEIFSVYPDAFFGVSVEGKGKTNYFLEVDRGTMPIIAAKDRPDIRKKLLGFFHYRNQKKHSNRYYYRTLPDGQIIGLDVSSDPSIGRQLSLGGSQPIKGFSVLFLAPGVVGQDGRVSGRIANILSSVPRLSPVIHRSTSLFWFAPDDAFELDNPASIFDHRWVTINPTQPLQSLIG